MKLRGSYVSNSSSSSYIIYGDIIESFDEIRKSLARGETVIGVQKDGGYSGDCADFVFNFTPERLKKLDKCFIGDNCLAIRKKWISKDKYGCFQIPKSEGGRLFSFRRDYSSPRTDSVADERFDTWLAYMDLKPNYEDKDEFLFGRRIDMDKATKTIADGGSFMVFVNGMFDWVLFPVKNEDDLKSLQKLMKFNRENECFQCNIYCAEPLSVIGNGELKDIDHHEYVFADKSWVTELGGVRDFWEKYLRLKDSWVEA